MKNALVFALMLLFGCEAISPRQSLPKPATRPMASALQSAKPWRPPLPVEVANGLSPAMDLLRSATAVESYRIRPTQDADLSQGILGYPLLSSAPPLSDAASRQLTNLVLDPRGYNGALWCGHIEPGVAFRYVSRSHVLTVLVCFKCQEWEFWLDGDRLGKDSFNGLQPELLHLVQALFPTDTAFRAILPNESFGRVYRIEALSEGAAGLPIDGRRELISEWEKKVMDAVGEISVWREAGGGKHSMRATEDGTGLIVITTANGHANIASLKGIKLWTVGE